LDYTKNLAILLAEFLPEGQHGSISTVPLGFKQNFNDESRVAEAAQMLLQYIAFAMEVEAHSGKVIQLALEPEPGCYLETTQGCIDFFTHHIFTKDSLNFLSTQVNDPASATFDRMRRYLGVCLDTCHAAVMFERPLLMAMALKEARIPIHKIQLTAALKQKDFSASSKEYLSPFAEEVYLHQSCVQNTATKSLDFYLDLPEALENASPGSELRTHFHVPVFVEDLGEIQTTQEELKELLSGFSENCWSTHLEVETYTFNVLPDSLRGGSIEENISREIQWVVDNLQ